MRYAVAVLLAATVGCGGRIFQESVALDAGADDAGPDATAGDDSGPPIDANGANGGRGPAPTPHCTGKNSACVYDEKTGTWTGAALVTCGAVPYVGPWNLLLEREVNGAWLTVQTAAVDKPGFGWTFNDTTAPLARLTYRVCTLDDLGTRCDDSFTTDGPPNCKCSPISCTYYRTCFQTVNDGCGSSEYCGACPDGSPCNLAYHACCPPGQMSDGAGGCACAPDRRCLPGEYWNTVRCDCEGIRKPTF